MRQLLKLTICTAILVSIFCQFAAAQNSFLPDENLGKYQSLKYVLTVQQDIESFSGEKVTDESVQEKIDDFFAANHVPCTRQTSASPLPCLIIKVVPQVGVGLVMHPVQICRVYFYVADHLGGANAVVWEDEVEGYFVGGGLANICQTYWAVIDEKLNNFRTAWFSTKHSQQGLGNPGNQNKESRNPQPVPSAQTRIETTKYTLDKSSADWKVTFKQRFTISLNDKAGTSLAVRIDIDSGYTCTLKAGQCLQQKTGENVLGIYTWKVITGLDRRSEPEENNAADNSNKNTSPYTIDKTKYPNQWVITFHTFMNIRVQPEKRYYICQPDFHIYLLPGQYAEKQNDDRSYTFMKDLDHR